MLSILHLVCHGVPEFIEDRLDHRVILEIERLLERTGGQAEAGQRGQQKVTEKDVASEPS